MRSTWNRVGRHVGNVTALRHPKNRYRGPGSVPVTMGQERGCEDLHSLKRVELRGRGAGADEHAGP